MTLTRTDKRNIFAAVRKMLGRGFRQAEVSQLDAVLDAAALPDDPDIALAGPVPSRIGEAGLALVKRFEGCKLQAYPDPGSGGDPWTIGWGTTRMGGRPVRKGDRIMQARADQLLAEQLVSYSAEVKRALGDAPTSQAQFDALVSFHYNTGAIGRATLTRKHKAGDFAGAEAEFHRWNRASGQVLTGLTRRRAAEAALYRSGQ